VGETEHGKQPIHSLTWDTCTHAIQILSITVCAIVKRNFSLACLSHRFWNITLLPPPCVVGLCPYIYVLLTPVYVCHCDRVTPTAFVCLSAACSLVCLCVFMCSMRRTFVLLCVCVSLSLFHHTKSQAPPEGDSLTVRMSQSSLLLFLLITFPLLSFSFCLF
jgi:hypothetical protein